MEHEDILTLARSLTRGEQDALTMRPSAFATLDDRRKGHARLVKLGLWHAPLVDGDHRHIRTPLGEQVRKFLLAWAL